jgi:hypothetical protein
MRPYEKIGKDERQRQRMQSPVRLWRRSRLAVLVAAVICFAVIHYRVLPLRQVVDLTSQELSTDGPKLSDTTPSQITGAAASEKTAKGICPDSPNANDILVVVRTGATEALEKLPVHFDTTLRCVPDYVVYSDFEEEIQGQHVYDVFGGISDELKASVPEFELYEHLRKHGREGLKNTTHLGSGPSGALDNPAWKLDRFKFLPMVDRALRHRPDAKWFVFVEADTYLVWQNLLEYLAMFDAEQPFYIGKHMYIGDVLFAHGGSGFVLSAAAARKVTQHRNANLAEYDTYTTKSWAGDMVLAKALRDVDVELFWAFPHFQGEPVSSLDHNVTKNNKRPWCYAPITYHHMRPIDIQKLWAFEQERHRQGNTKLLHRDVFKDYILPHLAAKVEDWDNLSMDIETDGSGSFEWCQAVCEAKTDCLRFSYAAGKCSTSTAVVLGEGANTRCMEYSAAASKCIRWQEVTQFAGSIQSGWMMERLERYVKEMDSACGQGEKDKWVVP